MFTPSDTIYFCLILFILWRFCEMLPYFHTHPDKKRRFYPFILTLLPILLTFLSVQFRLSFVFGYLMLLGPLIYLLIIWVKPNKTTLNAKDVVLFILLSVFSTFILPIILVAFAFNGTHLRFYLFWPLILFVIWLLTCILPWGKRHFKKVTTVALILVPLGWVVTAIYQHNPTTYFRFIRVPYPNGKEEILFNTDILKHVKRNQQIMALDLLNRYNGIKQIEFQDISETYDHTNPFTGGKQFTATVLINDKYRIYYEFDMLVNIDDLSSEDWPSYMEGPSNMDLYNADELTNSELTETGQLTTYGHDGYVSFYKLSTSSAQKKLNSIKIIYYENNDIYKDER